MPEHWTGLDVTQKSVFILINSPAANVRAVDRLGNHVHSGVEAVAGLSRQNEAVISPTTAMEKFKVHRRQPFK